MLVLVVSTRLLFETCHLAGKTAFTNGRFHFGQHLFPDRPHHVSRRRVP